MEKSDREEKREKNNKSKKNLKKNYSWHQNKMCPKEKTENKQTEE